MKVIVCYKNKLSKTILPQKIEGSFWVADEFTNNNIINIEAKNNKWILCSNDEAKIKINSSDNNYVEDLVLEVGKTFVIEYENNLILAYTEPNYDETINYYYIKENETISIGNADKFDINNTKISSEGTCSLVNLNDRWQLNISNGLKVYVNNFLVIENETKLAYGDVLFISGIRIVLYKNLISVNNIDSLTKINTSKVNLINIKQNIKEDGEIINSDSIKEIDFYKENDYFFKKARIRRFIETYELQVVAPPSKPTKEETPMILVLGPMLTMAIVSITTLSNNIMRIISGELKFPKAIFTLLPACSMLLTSLLWPNLTKFFQNRLKKRKEEERQKKYREYIKKKINEVHNVVELQSAILKENLVPLSECQNIILNKQINLWERRSDHKDFLTVRIGTATYPVDMKFNFQEEDFVLEEDELKKEMRISLDETKMLRDAPYGYSFNNKKVTALMGKTTEIQSFIDNILLQLLTFHSYSDLKIIFIVGKHNTNVWEKYKKVWHCFSDDKKIRYYADDIDEAKYISDCLMAELIKRFENFKDEAVQNENQETAFSPHYLIITDDYPMYRKLDIFENILRIKQHVGFSLICVENEMRRLPSECTNFINVNGVSSSLYRTDIDDFTLQNFVAETYTDVKVDECCYKLSNIPIEYNAEVHMLPTSLGFLEMFKVGKVEHLNTLNRWRLNDPITSLRTQIGINDQGNPIYLDLHEKFHGPHGLIAGTTGSGKSEFIITFILSLALNYSPNEVAFILIDYKGGGLAGAFENKSQGIRLPHLAGTITNLDKAELNRTLISIDSELKRRQKKFNEERDRLGESTIDIYKYQRLFREKKIKEPMPHLFIISDEFAELKAQQPEFMDDLISAARIGRSLGIHLILATQKPSGVVNDQIWSNTKFRVCLKVQDKSDSNEMLKSPEAASITNAGRFYLQVGNNEIFVLGQSGWAGTQYVASDTAKKKYDRSISFIDDTGNVIKNIEDLNTTTKKSERGDELSNVLKYICGLAQKESLKADNLWLDKIPADIYVDDLVKKYNYKRNDIVTAVIGEYDAPSKQHQNILTLTFNDEGNTLIYGMSGTNRELFLGTLIYSLCTQYKSEDINIYVIDYGAESLRMYGKFPQVGDMVFAGDEDKLSKLIDVISREIQYRKKLFAEYNGEYKTYKKLSGEKIPLKIVMINNYDSFKESHGSLEETLIKITREGERYGIILVITATGSRSLYSKLERNFHNTFMLDVNDRMDYIATFGKIGNLYPAECDGRGIFKDEEAYEFQTAQVNPLDNLLEFIAKRVELVKTVCKETAPNIPSLPEVVTLEHLLPSLNDVKNLPIGINKQNLKVHGYNFFNDKANIITAKNIKDCISLLNTIIFEVRKLNHMTVLIDTEQELSSIGGTVNTYVDKNFEEFILRFEDFLDKEIDGKNIKVLCIISGLEKFQGSLYEKKAKGFFNGVKTLENIHLIFVDSSFKLKKLGYENWYSSNVNNVNGIWVGPGFMEQTVISCNDYSNRFKLKINNQFAWVAKNGEANLIKIVGDNKEEDEDEE